VPAFDVWFTPTGRQDYRDLRADLQREVDAAVARLERHGCAAADYRLAGSDSDIGRICVVHLQRDWRLILGFPMSRKCGATRRAAPRRNTVYLGANGTGPGGRVCCPPGRGVEATVNGLASSRWVTSAAARNERRSRCPEVTKPCQEQRFVTFWPGISALWEP
jgi:hypothetical protein